MYHRVLPLRPTALGAWYMPWTWFTPAARATPYWIAFGRLYHPPIDRTDLAPRVFFGRNETLTVDQLSRVSPNTKVQDNHQQADGVLYTWWADPLLLWAWKGNRWFPIRQPQPGEDVSMDTLILRGP